jgi:uncharacterized surface protein with fasciclin (FAS1) repeats
VNKRLIASSLISASLVLAACGDDKDDARTDATTAVEAPAGSEAPTDSAPADSAPAAAGDIVAVASGNPDFSTLVAAVGAAGLVETLQGEGPFTVFAPTNEAFAAVDPAVLEALLKPENKDVLVQVLTYHVVSGKVMAADVTAGDVKSVQGSTIAVTTDGGVKLNGSANVVATDIAASNGVIHVIDAVILPADLDLSTLK